ncbi:MAG: cobalamin biosynthesis protein, partial [Acidimicrobiales bacterium]
MLGAGVVTRVLVCSVTAAGADLARRLPYEHRHGDLVATVRSHWSSVDGFVLACATGIAVRAIAPLLGGKATDPAVVCVGDGGRWAIALAGGHCGANALAHDVAGLLGAEAVVTTATDHAGLPALDALPGFTADGDVAAVTRAWLDGRRPTVTVDEALAGWRLPVGLVGGPGGDVWVSDRDDVAGRVVLRPRSLVVGVGASSGAESGRLAALVADALADAGLHLSSVAAVATVEAKRHEPAVVALAERLAVPLRVLPAAALAGVAVPNPSRVVDAAVGTPSVAEAAALLAAGPGAALVVEKRRTSDATVAVARRAQP